MKVTFTKERGRYTVLVDREKAPTLFGTGVGYDDALPHDLFHFFAEVEFGVEDGIFGTLAAGRPVKLFIPVDPKRRSRSGGGTGSRK